MKHKADKMLRGYSAIKQHPKDDPWLHFSTFLAVLLNASINCEDAGIQILLQRKFLLQLGETLCDLEWQHRNERV